MYFKKNEVTIVYNGEDNKGKQTLAYCGTFKKNVNKQDVNSVDVSSSLLSYLIEKYTGKFKDILNKADDYYQENLRGREFSPREWGYIIKHNPQLLIHPLIHLNGKTICCKTPTDIYKLSA